MINAGLPFSMLTVLEKTMEHMSDPSLDAWLQCMQPGVHASTRDNSIPSVALSYTSRCAPLILRSLTVRSSSPG